MTSIAANSANKALADFGAQKKPRVSTAVKRTENDDLRSEYSYQSSSHLATSSNFSSVLKNRIPGAANNSMVGLAHALHQPTQNPDLTTLSPGKDLTSLAPSMISYEDSIVNAEYNAITEEERARRRKEDKEFKQRQFLQRTKKLASQKMQEEMQSRQAIQIEN